MCVVGFSFDWICMTKPIRVFNSNLISLKRIPNIVFVGCFFFPLSHPSRQFDKFIYWSHKFWFDLLLIWWFLFFHFNAECGIHELIRLKPNQILETNWTCKTRPTMTTANWTQTHTFVTDWDCMRLNWRRMINLKNLNWTDRSNILHIFYLHIIYIHSKPKQKSYSSNGNA